MADFGLLEFQFSLERAAGGASQVEVDSYPQNHAVINNGGEAPTPCPPGYMYDQDEKLVQLIKRCKAILLSDLPHAFDDVFQEKLYYDQGKLADRLQTLPGSVVITCRGGHKKIVRIEFIAFLLVTKGFYDTFRDRSENWPSKEAKIRNHFDKHLNEIALAHPGIKEWYKAAPPNLWEMFCDLWMNDNCISWFKDAINWRPKSVKEILQNHEDTLEGYCGLTTAVYSKPPPRDTLPPQTSVPSGGSSSRALKNGRNRRQTLPVFTESALSAVVSDDVLFFPADNMQEPLLIPGDEIHAAVNCRMADGKITMIEVVTADTCYLIDCLKVGIGTACQHLSNFLANEHVLKLFHNLFQPAIAALRAQGDVTVLRGCVDSQLALEYKTGEIFGNFNKMLKHFDVPGKDRNDGCAKTSTKSKVHAPPGFQKLPSGNASKPALLLWASREHILNGLGETLGAIQRASDDRAKLESREVVFNIKKDYALVSRELALVVNPDDVFEPSPLVVNGDVDDLLYLLPTRMREALEEIGTEHLTDIILDKGRNPNAWINGKRIFLKGEDMSTVEQADIDCVTGGLGFFGSDNRAGIERQLHRVSCMRNRAGNIIGLTLRVGRNIDGNADMICDLLLGMEGSILFLGEPGSGKTTVVREAARLLSEDDRNVCIIDTSNEIAGDGDVPHPCVGHARRMMVPSLDQQAAVMIECVQNHTPSIMVIDEIGRPTEVEAARTCKQRGVRMIASAHGDLRKLAKNSKLKGLIGGIENVTLGDTAAKSEAKERGFSGLHKIKAQRAGAPVFDIIVEVRRDAHHDWYVTLDTAEAVDAILEGKQYEVQRRVRNPTNGSFQVLQEMR